MKPILLGSAKFWEVEDAIKENELKIRNLLPETWTHVANLDPVKIGFNLKLIGFDWRTNQEYAAFMGHLQKLKILELKNMLTRRSSHPRYQYEVLNPTEQSPVIYLGYSGDRLTK
jgi:hypothetical protein